MSAVRLAGERETARLPCERAWPPSEGAGVSRAEPLQNDVLHLSFELVARIDRCALDASALLQCEVTREAVILAAVAAWLATAHCRLMSAETQAIHLELLSRRAFLPHPQHWPKAMALRLDLIADTAGRALFCKVSRSAVVRSALPSWLEDAKHQRPKEDTTEAIRVALVTHEKQVSS